MLGRLVNVVYVCVAIFCAMGLRAGHAEGGETLLASVLLPSDASFSESLAAREIARYVYIRTARCPAIRTADRWDQGQPGIVVARKDRPLISAVDSLADRLRSLRPQEYLIKTLKGSQGETVLIVGGDDAGVLYGAYRFAEHLGVRFYLHGDVLPDRRAAAVSLSLDEKGQPLFGLRGIQPFHDFPEGPDWWNLDDYKAIISQLPKLGMNFIGLHTYPEDRPAAEPTVWIGLPNDVESDGKVRFSYPAIYYNTTLPVGWGFQAKKTSDYMLGAAGLFDRDSHSSQVLYDLTPQPKTPDQCNEVFNRAGALYRQAFDHAHRLGIKTCVGTETPLVIPREVRARLKELGKDPNDPKVVGELYEGMFRRIMASYPVDFYWLWTPEGWTWEGTKEEQIRRTLDDIRSAHDAIARAGASFRLGTCGWVLGPAQDRALFDRELPRDMFVSCISRQVGHDPVEPGFSRVKDRGKWAIPWLEDDPAMISPQLWVGRMRRDAADALRYGCDGLMGIHWRTRILSMNVSALAKAAWDQSGWTRHVRSEGPLGGQVAAFASRDFAGTEDDTLYQTVRFDVYGYYFPVPDGTYTVTLRFCEPAHSKKGARVFGVNIEGQPVIDRLDIFEKVGKDRALDCTFKDVRVSDGWLDIDFLHQVEFPCIAAIEVAGDGYSRKINCGGPAYKDFTADPPATPRRPPVDDFYRDWAASQFGPEAAADIAAIFTAIDCNLPRPSDWVNGPGGIKPDARPWETVMRQYAFVDDLAAIRPRVTGAGNTDRFGYWLHTMRYLRANGRVNCIWARYNAAWKKVADEKDPAAKKRLAESSALPIRIELVQAVTEVYRHLLAVVGTTGEMGTVANWEQHLQPDLLNKPGEELSKVLGAPLPPEALLSKDYSGPVRIIVPTVRGSMAPEESLTLKVILLSQRPPQRAELCWRAVSTADKPSAFNCVALSHVARGVYSVTIPAPQPGAILVEYYVHVGGSEFGEMCWPPTAPELCQTVVITPARP